MGIFKCNGGTSNIMDKVLDKIKYVSLKYHNINKVVLFGSRARKDNTQTSDYDIAVFSNNLPVSEKSAFLDGIEAIETLNKIDVIFIQKRHIDTEIYKNIVNDGVIIMDKFQIKLNNYKNALSRLHESLKEAETNNSLTVRDGVIQRFEFTSELAWKTIREYLLTQEITDINSPKSVMSEAYNNRLITNDTGWLQILRDRNSTSHIYDEEDAAEIYKRIAFEHILLFDELLDVLVNIN